MVTDIGLIALLLSGICAFFALFASVFGVREKREEWTQAGRNALIVIAPLLTLSALTIIYANLTNDYRLEYAAQVSSRATPTLLKITGLWGGQNGSLLFWVWLMSLFSMGVLLSKWKTNRPFSHAQGTDLMPYVAAVLATIQLFFIGLVVFYANPFAKLWELSNGQIVGAILPPANALPFTAADGQGLAPLLRHPGMIIHPPFLYLGFVGFTVPFAFAVAALISGISIVSAEHATGLPGRLGWWKVKVISSPIKDAWIRTTRRWTLMAWLFLSMGLLLGARWAYDVLGWGGYWGWDAVENAALLPWLSATAFVHSVMIQEKRGMLKIWNMFLIILTFCQVILGTFITRTGVVSSVHSFARSSIGVPFLLFTGITLLGSIGLLLLRLDDLKSENKLDNLFSREAVFLLQNVLFVLINFVVALGTYFPILSELFTNNKITVGPPYYNQTVGPLLVPLILLMGIAPLVSWRAASPRALGRMLWLPAALAVAIALVLILLGVPAFLAVAGFGIVAFTGSTTLIEYGRGVMARHKAAQESYPLALWHLVGRNRRRYGGYLIHMSVILMAIGVIGTHYYQVETQRTLEPGQSFSINDYTLQFVQLEQMPTGEPDKQILSARVSVSQGNGAATIMHPFQEIYDNGERMTPPALLSSLKQDLYLLVAGWESDGSSVTLKVFVNPLVNWLWIGGLVFIFGTLVAAWPAEEGAKLKVESKRWNAEGAKA